MHQTDRKRNNAMKTEPIMLWAVFRFFFYIYAIAYMCTNTWKKTKAKYQQHLISSAQGICPNWVTSLWNFVYSQQRRHYIHRQRQRSKYVQKEDINSFYLWLKNIVISRKITKKWNTKEVCHICSMVRRWYHCSR